VRVESMAAGSYEVDQTPTEPEQDAHKPITLRDLIPGIDPTVEADRARVFDQLSHPNDGGHGQV
jgi:hypothetical protein